MNTSYIGGHFKDSSKCFDSGNQSFNADRRSEKDIIKVVKPFNYNNQI